MSQPIYVVDAFTEVPFRGNPAGVCPLDVALDERIMQSIAMEMNHAETAFPLRRADGDWDLRWFTPACEVDLCGHATLASAHILWSTGRAEGALRFHTRSGVLTAAQVGDQIELDFPSERADPLALDVTEVLDSEPVWFGKNRMDYLAELPSEQAVLAFAPKLDKIRALGMRGLIVTARSSSGEYDFVSRFFGPNAGVDEDSVTGSAHCCLGPYWASRLGRNSLVGYQASRRGGFVGVEVDGDRVRLRGRAVTVVAGVLDSSIGGT